MYTVIDATESLSASRNLGECSNTSQELLYSLKQGSDQLKDTVLHEILHAIDYAVQANLKERQVHIMATGILSVLRDNKKLAEWLLS